MFERFTKEAREVVERARDEALDTGSETIEAEHLLLALSRRGLPALRAIGLDHAACLEALEGEFARSLAVAGVTWDAPIRSRATLTSPRFGASAKLALERALRAAVERGDRRLGARHVLLGVLRAELGTVPRALDGAGIDRAALAASV
jgi:ATP-dependent Clp protease ATP-binding subunit ClpA